MLTVAQQFVVDKSTGVAWAVAKDVLQLAVFATRDIDDAMEHVDAGVHGLYGGVRLAPFHITTYRVVSHSQWQYLLEMKDVFNDDDGTAAALVGMLVKGLFTLTVAQTGHPHTNAELLVAVRAYEHQ